MQWLGFEDAVRRLRGRAIDVFWERYFGVATLVPEPSLGSDSRVYVTLPYAAIFFVLKRLEMRPTDVFFDIGCGKGRVLLVATRFKLTKIVGVELSPGLADQTRANIAKQSNVLSNTAVLNAAAQDVDLREGNVFFLYNPFGPDTFRAFLRSLGQSLCSAPRQIKIAYVRPCHEDVFHEFDWLERSESYEVTTWAGKKLQVSVWCNSRVTSGKS